MRTRHTTRPPQDRPGAFGADLDEVVGQGVLVGLGRRGRGPAVSAGRTGGGGGVHGILGVGLMDTEDIPKIDCRQ